MPAQCRVKAGGIAVHGVANLATRRSKAISRELTPAKQGALIKGYEALLNRIKAEEAVVFADAVQTGRMEIRRKLRRNDLITFFEKQSGLYASHIDAGGAVHPICRGTGAPR